MERTFAIIKPDAVKRNLEGKILTILQERGLRVVAMKKMHLTKAQAEGFYAVHKERPFFDSLTSSMCAGPIVAMILEGENAIPTWRTLMGATDPAKADEGTLRKLFAVNLEQNSVHGSDAPETAAFEMGYFFNAMEIVG